VTRGRRNWFNTALRNLGITGFTWHDLRHTGQTLAMQRGATMKDLQRRAGHATQAAALGYLHGSAEQDRVIADAMSPDVENCLELMRQIKSNCMS
jgi:integrase